MVGQRQRHPSKLQGHRKKPAMQVLAQPAPLLDLDALDAMTKTALQELAAERDLPKSGTKADLIARIRLHIETEEADAAVPPLPAAFGEREPKAETLRRWREMWRSQSASQWDRDGDMGELTRYIVEFDAWLELYPAAIQQPFSRGSMGQVSANPLFGVLDKMDKRLRDTEEAFAMTPRARLRMGVEIGDAAMGLERAEQVMARHAIEVDEFAVPDGWVIEG